MWRLQASEKMSEYTVFHYHHGDRFRVNSEGNFDYKHGSVEVMPPLDPDYINVRDMVYLFKMLGYHDYKAMYRQKPEDMYLETGLMPLEKDSHINAMVECMMRCSSKNEMGDYEMHIFFEHPILDIEGTEFVSDPISVEDSECNRGVLLISPPPEFQAASESEHAPTECPEPAPAEPAFVPFECAELVPAECAEPVPAECPEPAPVPPECAECGECSEPAPGHADFVEAAPANERAAIPQSEGPIDAALEQGSCSRNKVKATAGSRKKRKVAASSRKKKVKATVAPASSKSGKKKSDKKVKVVAAARKIKVKGSDDAPAAHEVPSEDQAGPDIDMAAHEVPSEDHGYSSNNEYMHTPVSSEDEGNYPVNP